MGIRDTHFQRRSFLKLFSILFLLLFFYVVGIVSSSRPGLYFARTPKPIHNTAEHIYASRYVKNYSPFVNRLKKFKSSSEWESDLFCTTNMHNQSYRFYYLILNQKSGEHGTDNSWHRRKCIRKSKNNTGKCWSNIKGIDTAELKIGLMTLSIIRVVDPYERPNLLSRWELDV